jgi:AcrR family transcriptional regulator
MTSSAAERAAPGAVAPASTRTTNPPAVIGLRERKKARTRIAIRSEAIRLFTEQGFSATTVEQIAEAAEVSPSTFFRYFPTKEAVIITDEFDPLIFQAFRDQPPEASPIQAFRAAMTTVFSQVSPEAAAQERMRHQLLQSVPELRSAMMEEFANSLLGLSELIGERVHRAQGDPAIRAMAGAIMGVVLSVTMTPRADPTLLNMVGDIDEALALLEAGLPL